MFGLVLVLFPGLTRQGFSLMIYSDAHRIARFGDEAVDYIELVHAVMGAVMVGWGTALLLILRGPFHRDPDEGARIIAISLTAWFIADTAFSLRSGFWENAVLNVAFAALFAIPLIGLHRARRSAT